MHRVIGFAVFFVSILLIPIMVVGQPDYERWGEEYVVATAEVNIWMRASEPAGLFCSRGKKLGIIEKGQDIKVRKYINAKCGIFFKYDYLEIEILNPKPNQPPWGIVSAVNDDGSPLFSEKTNGAE